MGDAGRARKAAEPEPWWAVIDSSTEDSVGGAVDLEEALQAFAMSVEVDGLEGGWPTGCWAGNICGEGGWRLRLVERGGIPEIQAAYVMLKARAKRGKVSRMRALAVQEKRRGRGLAANAIRVQGAAGWLGWLAGS